MQNVAWRSVPDADMFVFRQAKKPKPMRFNTNASVGDVFFSGQKQKKPKPSRLQHLLIRSAMLLGAVSTGCATGAATLQSVKPNSVAFPPLLEKDPNSDFIAINTLPGKRTISPLLYLAKGATVSDAFILEIDQAFKSLPPQVRKVLTDGHEKIVLTRFMVDAFPYLKKEQPRGWDQGKTFYHVDGLRGRFIGMAEYFWADEEGGRCKPVEAQGEKIDKVLCRTTNAAGVLRHEIGHAFDALRRVSKSEAFKKAYAEDHAWLTVRDKRELKYFIQPDKNGKPTDAGRSEAAGEIFAALQGGGCRSARFILMRFPEAAGVIKAMLDRLEGKPEEYPLMASVLPDPVKPFSRSKRLFDGVK